MASLMGDLKVLFDSCKIAACCQVPKTLGLTTWASRYSCSPTSQRSRRTTQSLYPHYTFTPCSTSPSWTVRACYCTHSPSKQPFKRTKQTTFLFYVKTPKFYHKGHGLLHNKTSIHPLDRHFCVTNLRQVQRCLV